MVVEPVSMCVFVCHVDSKLAAFVCRWMYYDDDAL